MEKKRELNRTQKMLTFAFLADITSGVVFDTSNKKDQETDIQQDFERELQGALNNIVTNSEITPYLGDGWTCRDYPWVDIEKDSRGIFLSRNTTAIFINGNDVVIAVAGTNFVENYDWFTEDLGVVVQKPWADVVNSLSGTEIKETGQSQGVIAGGTVIALTNTWLQKGSVSGKNLVDDLKEIVSGMTEIRLTVTGHSLGGAISPVLAQALWELRELWMPASSTVSVAAYPFAGPTVGNQAFVDYVQPKEPKDGKIQLVSTYNTRDVVPHGWNLNMMKDMHDLFVPIVPDADTDEYAALIRATIQWLIGKSTHATQSDDYVRWNHEERFQGDFPSKAYEKAQFVLEADAFASYLRGELERSENWDTRDAMKKIIGTSDLLKKSESDKFFKYLVYLSKYLLMLGKQHISEYAAKVYNNKDYHGKIKKLTKAEKSKWRTKYDSKAGMNVLKQLFTEVAEADL